MSATAGDVLVVGAGVAGSILARTLAERGHKVTMIEAGGYVPHTSDRDRRTGKVVTELGVRDFRIQTSSGVGGTSHIWGVRLGGMGRGVRLGAPSEPDLRRAGRPVHEQWPFGLDVLQPHLVAVLDQAVDHRPAGDPFAGPELGLFSTPGTSSKNFYFASQSLFTDPARLRHPNIELRRNLRVDRLVRNAAGRITSVSCLDESTSTVQELSADHVVIACGTPETLRLLLASGLRDDDPADTLVGRYFMERPRYQGHTIEVAHHLVEPIIDELQMHRRRMVHLRMEADHAGPAISVTPFHETLQEYRPLYRRLDAAHDRMRYLYERLPGVLGPQTRRVREAATAVVDSIEYATKRQQVADWDHLQWRDDPKAGALRFQLRGLFEHLPHPDNRLTLDDETDRFGRRRVRAEYCFLHDERALATARLEAYVAELEPLGVKVIGTPGMAIEDVSSNHFMGGARMGIDPATSVVDPDLRMHGIENLSVLSLAVYPASGYVNPTLTVMALAHRLGGHLASR